MMMEKMKVSMRTLTAMVIGTAVIAVCLFTVSACNDDDDATTSPAITSFTPASGVVGTTVIITGTNFSTSTSANTATFNGITATVTAATETQLTVTVPTSATTGKIAVTVNSVTVTSSSDFTITTTSTSAPTITSFTPTSGAEGITVTITGTNFSTTLASNTVTFNGTAATVTAATATQLTVTVPTGATTGKIAVSVNTSSTTATSTDDFTVTATTTADCSSATTTAEKVVCLAEAFKATLTSTQITSLQIAYTKANAIRWSNLPCGLSCRNGLAFSSLTATQLAAAKAVIAAASGTSTDEGYSEFSQVNAADDVLGTKSGNTSSYSSGNYIIAFLGAPSTTGTWMLQFGGHHYAQNITYTAGTVVSITPSHQGIEPKTWTTNGTTYAPLASERSVMAEMLASFTTAELASAKNSSTFSDVLMVPGSTSNTMPATKQGIKVSTLSSAAQLKVLAAMAPWVNDLDATSAESFLAIYTSELADTYVTYASNSSGTSGNASTFLTANTDYVRIDGPSVWIEFICQTGVVYPSEIHYHAVFRDHKRDYIGL